MHVGRAGAYLAGARQIFFLLVPLHNMVDTSLADHFI